MVTLELASSRGGEVKKQEPNLVRGGGATVPQQTWSHVVAPEPASARSQNHKSPKKAAP
jgi:hypothetical protein